MRAILHGARLPVLSVQRPVAVKRRAQQDLASGLEHRSQGVNQTLVVGDMLDCLQADDLVKHAQCAAVILQLAQVNDAKIDAGYSEHVSSSARALLLTWQERRRHHLVADACGEDAESTITTTRIERPHASTPQMASQPQPPVQDARVACDEQESPPENPEHRVRHARRISHATTRRDLVTGTMVPL